MSKKQSGNRIRISAVVQVVLLAAALAAHISLVFYYDFTQDDAWITFRYAQNFLDGNGLVYNIGERVEGYTNFLWTVLMILGKQIGFGFVGLSKTLGTIFGSATILLMFFLGRLLFRDISGTTGLILPAVSCLILGSVYSFAYWAGAGLETTAFAFFVLLSIYSYLRRSMLAIPSLVLSTLLRPEGGLVFAFIVCYELISRRAFTAYIRAAVSLYIIFLLPFLAFKLIYYSSILPNSFYAKTAFSMTQILNGLSYTGQHFYHYLALGIFLVPVIAIFRKSSRNFKTVVIFLLVYTVYIILIGGDVLKVHRFFIPIIPFFIIAIIYAFATLITKRSYIALCIVLVLGWQLYIPSGHISAFHKQELGLAKKMDIQMDWLLAVDSSDFSMAVSTIGLAGYRLMGHHVIDMLGLTDSTIARHPERTIVGMKTSWREAKFNSGYVLSREPDYILFSTSIKPSAPAEYSLFLYSAFLNNYRAVGFPVGEENYSVYKRYFPIEQPVSRDVDDRFAVLYQRAIDHLVHQKNSIAAIAVLDSAAAICPGPGYPYIEYWKSFAYKGLRQWDEVNKCLYRMITIDTLVYEGLMNLSIMEMRRGNQRASDFYRAKTLQLVPWFEATLDTMLGKY